MIELAIDIGWGTTPRFNIGGNVLVAKLAGAIWGRKEQYETFIVQRDDPAIELQLMTQQLAGEQFPMIDYPYGVRDVDGNVIVESLVRLDFTQLPLDLQQILRDPLQLKRIVFAPAIWWLRINPPDAGFFRSLWNRYVLGYLPA